MPVCSRLFKRGCQNEGCFVDGPNEDLGELIFIGMHRRIAMQYPWQCDVGVMSARPHP
jgi:hypothetical protein